MHIIFDLRLEHKHSGYRDFAIELTTKCVEQFPENTYYIITNQEIEIPTATTQVVNFSPLKK